MIPLLGAQTYSVTTTAAGSWGDGEFGPGASSVVSVRGSLQPATPEMIENAPPIGGSRTSALWGFWTEAELVVCDVENSIRGDIVSTDIGELEVIAVEDWTILPGHGLRHRVYTLRQRGADDGTS